MKRTNKWAIVLMITLCGVLILCAGCKKAVKEESAVEIIEETFHESSAEKTESSQSIEESKQEPSHDSSQESSKPEDTIGQTSEDIINDPNMNPLTGEIEDHPTSNKRPVCFMTNNHPDAVPQVGISEADIILEAIIEGGATRMLTIFQEMPDDVVIGGIRSLRHNYIDFAAWFDAIITHCGCSNLATDALERRGYNDIDAVSWAGGIFYRDPWRDANMGYVHSLVTTGEAVNDFLENDAPFRIEHEADYHCNLVFSSNPIVSGGNVMNDVDVFFGDYKHTLLSFDASTNDYTASEYGDLYIDYETDEPVHFKNIVVIKTDVWECDGIGHQDMTLTGEGEGWFCVNGACAQIKWSRTDEDAQFVFTYLDGSPVIFGVGKTYIAVVNLDGGIE